SPQEVDSLVRLAAPLFDIRRMRAVHPYAFIFSDDSLHTPPYFVYEADQVEHVVFELGPLSVREGRRPIRTEERTMDCTVTVALYNDIITAGADPMLAITLA